jgi:hypothetical protein
MLPCASLRGGWGRGSHRRSAGAFWSQHFEVGMFVEFGIVVAGSLTCQLWNKRRG